ncbi:unnamed protein product [Amoebophrya sp. A120]|nr:unnamed protein product [Amoebophrya sp. A120]|eukprot:GSA120T00003072001.1
MNTGRMGAKKFVPRLRRGELALLQQKEEGAGGLSGVGTVEDGVVVKNPDYQQQQNKSTLNRLRDEGAQEKGSAHFATCVRLWTAEQLGSDDVACESLNLWEQYDLHLEGMLYKNTWKNYAAKTKSSLAENYELTPGVALSAQPPNSAGEASVRLDSANRSRPSTSGFFRPGTAQQSLFIPPTPDPRLLQLDPQAGIRRTAAAAARRIAEEQTRPRTGGRGSSCSSAASWWSDSWLGSSSSSSAATGARAQQIIAERRRANVDGENGGRTGSTSGSPDFFKKNDGRAGFEPGLGGEDGCSSPTATWLKRPTRVVDNGNGAVVVEHGTKARTTSAGEGTTTSIVPNKTMSLADGDEDEKTPERKKFPLGHWTKEMHYEIHGTAPPLEQKPTFSADDPFDYDRALVRIDEMRARHLAYKTEVNESLQKLREGMQATNQSKVQREQQQREDARLLRKRMENEEVPSSTDEAGSRDDGELTAQNRAARHGLEMDFKGLTPPRYRSLFQEGVQKRPRTVLLETDKDKGRTLLEEDFEEGSDPDLEGSSDLRALQAELTALESNATAHGWLPVQTDEENVIEEGEALQEHQADGECVPGERTIADLLPFTAGTQKDAREKKDPEQMQDENPFDLKNKSKSYDNLSKEVLMRTAFANEVIAKEPALVTSNAGSKNSSKERMNLDDQLGWTRSVGASTRPDDDEEQQIDEGSRTGSATTPATCALSTTASSSNSSSWRRTTAREEQFFVQQEVRWKKRKLSHFVAKAQEERENELVELKERIRNEVATRKHVRAAAVMERDLQNEQKIEQHWRDKHALEVERERRQDELHQHVRLLRDHAMTSTAAKNAALNHGGSSSSTRGGNKTFRRLSLIGCVDSSSMVSSPEKNGRTYSKSAGAEDEMQRSLDYNDATGAEGEVEENFLLIEDHNHKQLSEHAKRAQRQMQEVRDLVQQRRLELEEEKAHWRDIHLEEKERKRNDWHDYRDRVRAGLRRNQAEELKRNSEVAAAKAGNVFLKHILQSSENGGSFGGTPRSPQQTRVIRKDFLRS